MGALSLLLGCFALALPFWALLYTPGSGGEDDERAEEDEIKSGIAKAVDVFAQTHRAQLGLMLHVVLWLRRMLPGFRS